MRVRWRGMEVYNNSYRANKPKRGSSLRMIPKSKGVGKPSYGKTLSTTPYGSRYDFHQDTGYIKHKARMRRS